MMDKRVYLVFGSAAILALVAVAYVWFPWEPWFGITTHGEAEVLTQAWMLGIPEKNTSDRIYSGRGGTILLTVTINRAPGSPQPGEIEVLVNGARIQDGILGPGDHARTFKRSGVFTVDIRLNNGGPLAGRYKISTHVYRLR